MIDNRHVRVTLKKQIWAWKDSDLVISPISYKYSFLFQRFQIPWNTSTKWVNPSTLFQKITTKILNVHLHPTSKTHSTTVHASEDFGCIGNDFGNCFNNESWNFDRSSRAYSLALPTSRQIVITPTTNTCGYWSSIVTRELEVSIHWNVGCVVPHSFWGCLDWIDDGGGGSWLGSAGIWGITIWDSKKFK